MPRKTRYEMMGEQAAVERLVVEFFRRLDADAAAAPARTLYPESLEQPIERLTLFVVAWFGGPLWYHAKYGQPRLRASHAEFAIDDAARDAWMTCMREALVECVPDEELRLAMLHDFQVVADHVHNRP